jgi:4-hydroxy-tetrahydrodipicolinate reductase
MGHAVERVARAAGHEIVKAAEAEVVVDFSQADAIEHALALATQHHIALVIGTTGWHARLDEVRARVEEAGIGCVYASNFSPGANVTFALARRAGELFARFPQYDAGMEERHHAMKKDAPSGTALKIAAEVKEGSGGRFDPTIVSSRAGAEFGLHTLFFDSPDDVVEISHRARGREGFARGAVLAAELVRGRKGLFRFDQLLE